ncbi:MAG: hypothetical protein JWN52_5380 [Actinomycetia bacterium]|nr:hypothetical protein [Actinomycetes bacterium]
MADLAAKKKLQDAYDGLWNLFSFEAAAREAELERVVDPFTHQANLDKINLVLTDAHTVQAALPSFLVDELDESARPTTWHMASGCRIGAVGLSARVLS